jgi:moderate conductance mechanosensitive channel
MTKGGVGIGNFNISTEQLTYAAIKVVKIISMVILIYLSIRIGSAIIHKFMERQRKSNSKFTLNEKRSMTLEAILKSILRYTVYFFGIVGILTEVFGTISLTFAGIGGVAIGFGAQSLVKDIINGFFILFEDQYAVGDYINIDDKGGIVESIELRVTKIRDFNGDLHIIPNGLISKVTNHSRGDIRVLVEFDVPYDTEIDRVIRIVSEVCEKFKLKNNNMVEGPKVLGVSALKDSSITIKVMGKSKSMTQWDSEMELRREIKMALDREKIEAPYPKRKIVKGD